MGMFTGELMPNEWLSSVDEIAEKWARRSFLQPAAAKGLIVSLEGFIEGPAVARGKYLVVIGSRCAKGDDFRVVRARYEVRVV